MHFHLTGPPAPLLAVFPFPFPSVPARVPALHGLTGPPATCWRQAFSISIPFGADKGAGAPCRPWITEVISKLGIQESEDRRQN
jgi:hypothetical protein